MSETRKNHNRIYSPGQKVAIGLLAVTSALAAAGLPQRTLEGMTRADIAAALVPEKGKANDGLTPYMPNSKAAKQNPAKYNTQFEEYRQSQETPDAGSIGQIYAKKHSLDSQEAARDEVLRQAEVFNREHYDQEHNDTIYPGQSFMLDKHPEE